MTATRKKRSESDPEAARDYARLVAEWIPRPITDAKSYDAATAIIDRLSVRPEGSLSPGEQIYLDAVTRFVQLYDDERSEPPAKKPPLDVLRYLMRESGMSQTQLGDVLGHRGLASLVLSGKRGFSPGIIRKLADHFNVDPALFFSP